MIKPIQKFRDSFSFRDNYAPLEATYELTDLLCTSGNRSRVSFKDSFFNRCSVQWLLTICDIITVRYVSDVGKRICEWHDLNSKPERKESSYFER